VLIRKIKTSLMPNRKKVLKSIYSSKINGFFLPWPATVFVLLCLGVLLLGWTFKTAAEDINVTAKVSAAALTEPAVITNPVNNQRFSSIPITVSGTCPDGSYVNVYRNNIFSGSVVCNNKAFELTMDLFPGANELRAQDYNVTDDAGPSSSPITVYYDVPARPAPKKGQPNPANYPPFILQTEFKLTGFEVGQLATWKLQVNGGVAPYEFNVDWGDGTKDKLSQAAAGEFEISHTYEKAGKDGGYYTIKISANDSAGQKAFLQFFLLIKPKQGTPTGTITTKKPNNPFSGINSETLLLLAWPAYGIVVLMSLSYWLGEREEVVVLKRLGKLKR
jgi:hypothetical protein